MKYEDLLKVNSKLKGIDVKGKDYVQVNDRVMAFRELFPNGTISTELISNDNGVCVMRTIVTDGERMLASGMAYEKETSSFINKTSYIENCETSAVGRALGFLGIGIAGSIASAEEIQNAIKNQEDPEKTISKDMLTTIMAELKRTGIGLKSLCKAYAVESIDRLPVSKYKEVMDKLTEKPTKETK